ncbi:MAG: SusC/RagA family TonB-linked outer membrane protein [Mangrovibacterium sp.]
MLIRYKMIVLALFVLLGANTWAQNLSVSGQVTDRKGHPVSGALITSVSDPAQKAYTDKSGKFQLFVISGDQLRVLTADNSSKTVAADTDKPMTIQLDLASESVDLGFGIRQTAAESTAAISKSTAAEVNSRSAFSISNSLFGNALGLTSLQNSGPAWEQEPSFYIRGLQTLSNNDILILVDGLERDIKYVVPEEVESVSVLRDAAAVALYGYRGINGVLSIKTIRGKYKTNDVNVSFDHAFKAQTRLPKMVNAYTYANAVNEALANDGDAVRYSQNELNAFQSGEYPNMYANVDWFNEVFRDNGYSNIYNVNFRGGGQKMRYFTMFNLQGNQGFYKNAEMNDGYSTQEKFSKGNIRTNLDIDVTPNTLVQINLMGVLNEFSRPGLNSDNLFGRLYNTPAAAFPIQTADGIWGGNATWGGSNPVALSQARGYSKGHTRALYADVKLTQDLKSIVEGLSASVRLGYDNVAAYWEGHNKTFAYASDAVVAWENGVPIGTSRYSAGADSELGFSNSLDWQNRHMNFIANADYQTAWDKSKFFGSLIYSFENLNQNGQHYTYYRQNVSLYGHYVYDSRFIADVALVSSASNKLAPGARWGFSPTMSAAWVLSNEEFFKDVSLIDFLKLRASWGIINTDRIPAEDYWEQSFVDGGGYNLGDNYTWFGGTAEGRLASLKSSREKAIKYNLGVDAGLLGGLTATIDGFYERRKDIWVSEGGANSAVLGISSPYVNAGIVDSWGFEAGANYFKQWGDLKLDVGAKFTLAKNEIKEQLEEPRAYDYLRSTGNSVSQIFGLQAVGFFIDEADINNSPAQQFSEVKAGDIKYKDQNADGIINDYDVIPMGYNSTVPEVYYSFNVGVEYKGFGLSALFQGAANYTAVLNTSSMYWPLINNTNISQNYFDNRWTPETPFAKYPRLTAQSNDNNFRTNSVWLADASFLKLRNCELYYKLPASFLTKMKMKSAKIYVRGVDLLSIDNIDLSDPESVGITTPMTRSVHVGLAVGF